MKRRYHLIVEYIKCFWLDNKRAIISCIIVFILGIGIGIAMTILEFGGEFEHIKPKDIVYGSFRVFLNFTLLELIAYFVFLFAALHFLLVLLSMLMLGVVGFAVGKYSVILVGCYAVKGVMNLLFVYFPALLLTFITMMSTLIRIVELGGCGGSYKNRYSQCRTRHHCYDSYKPIGTKIMSIKLKPSIVVALKGYGINAALNFFCFVFMGLFIPVIAV